jgi:predicted RNA-binding Zn-ribbon protein involved in translation (DUF1610 family)
LIRGLEPQRSVQATAGTRRGRRRVTLSAVSQDAPPAYTRCPKCGHRPLPQEQSLPAACPACGVILAKVALARRGVAPARSVGAEQDVGENVARRLAARLFELPERVDRTRWWLRVVLLAALALWGLALVRLDVRSGEMGASFLHGVLLVFHEAGHVLFSPFGEWLSILGGTLGQLLMPAVVIGAFLWRNRDPFGAAVGLWLLGVSLLDVAPYMVDALDPKLMLLSGGTGEEGGHDWIALFESMGLLRQAQRIGVATHALGALVVGLALAWAARLLWLQRGRIGGGVQHEG